MAIKGLGESAAEAIVAERENNGPYKDLFDFVQRVPMSSVKRSGMECLALSGAFDAFKEQIRREQFFGYHLRRLCAEQSDSRNAGKEPGEPHSSFRLCYTRTERQFPVSADD